MKRSHIPLSLFFALTLIFTTCEQTPGPKDEISIELALEGAVQKGPFLNGTAVRVTELEIDLSPTGRTFSSQIENNAGLFNLPTIEYSSQYIELQADGYYFNEIRNAASDAPLTLYAISDIINRTTINVNMISTLERPRVKYLLSQGVDYAAAKDSAFKEVINIFSFTSSSLTSSEDLSIMAAGNDNAMLLAVSLILQGDRSEGELSELVSNISFDLREDGLLSNTNSLRELYRGVNQVGSAEARDHLETRYENLGLQPEIGDFESFIDSFRNQESSLSLTVEKQIDCSGDDNSRISVAGIGGFPPYQYNWSNGATTDVLEGIGPGYYSVEVLDDNHQSMTADSIYIPGRMLIDADIIHIDPNTTGEIDLTITGGEGPYSIIWSNGTTSEDLVGVTSGQYTVTVTDVNSCSVDTTIELLDLQNIVDIDGNVYSTVIIGDQIWLRENLKVTHYRNGEPIPNVTSNTEWEGLTSGAYCDYENNADHVNSHGRLYNWHAINDSRNIALFGWRVPTDEDWQTLIEFLGGAENAGGKMKETGTGHWNSPNNGATNESGFTALPSGQRDFNGGYFEVMGYSTAYWSTTSTYSGSAWTRRLDYNDVHIGRNSSMYTAGISVRLVKD